MTGSIACYKACGILSKLVQLGHKVKVVLTPSSLEFIGKSTIEGLTNEPPIVSLFEPGAVMDHIHLNRWADLVLVAPATASYINKIATGLGDDLVTTLFLAHDFTKPFLIAPAMNTKMYLHFTTQASIQKLKEHGIVILETASGVLACGETGYGRLLEPDLIVTEIQKHLGLKKENDEPQVIKPSLKLKVLVTGGGTSEPIDDVRVITNKSTGTTAFKIVNNLSSSGAEVTFLKSSTVKAGLTTDPSVHTEVFTTFKDLENLMQKYLANNNYDWVIHAAAVSDYSVEASTGKISSEAKEITLKLSRNPKLIEKIKDWAPSTKLVGFKLTSTQTEQEVMQKVNTLFAKSSCDLVVQNDWQDIQNDNHRFQIFSKTKKIQAENNDQLSLILFQEITQQELL